MVTTYRIDSMSIPIMDIIRACPDFMPHPDDRSVFEIRKMANGLFGLKSFTTGNENRRD
jgi:hypothetical protein